MKIAIITLAATARIAIASPYLSSISGHEGTDSIYTNSGGPYETIDLSGLNSWDLQGDANNEHLSLLVGAGGVHVTSIGWDVNIMTKGSSWLSEPVIDIEGELFLTPGLGDDFAGTGSYSSGGMLDLVSLGLDFIVSADGILNFEFFESFDDVDGEIDAVFGAGSAIYVQYVLTPPTPGAAMTLALSGLIAGRRRRTPWPAHTT